MKFLAFMKDSLRETMDKKSFWTLGILSFLFVLFCFSISFSPTTPHESLSSTVEVFNIVVGGEGLRTTTRRFFDLKFTVEDVQEDVSREDRTREGGYRFKLRADPLQDFFQAVLLEKGLRAGTIKKASDEVPGKGTNGYPEPPTSDQVWFLRRRFVRGGFSWPDIQRTGAGEFSVRARPMREQLVRGGHKVSYLFGLADEHLKGQSVAQKVASLELVFGELVAGFFGVICALIFTAFFIPGMLEKGNVEIILSKPIHRVTLITYKYLGGLLYVFLLAMILIGGSWLGLSLRSGYWKPTYLYSIGVLTFYFGILYSVSVLFGVLWRSWIGSVLMTALAWIAFTASGVMYSAVHGPMPIHVPRYLVWITDALYWTLPKTHHLSALNQVALIQSNLGGGLAGGRDLSELILPAAVTWPNVILTSLASVVLVLGLASWRFVKKDY